jgi:hypothetical protein
MALLDFAKLAFQAQSAAPGEKSVFQQMSEFMAAWLEFMHKLKPEIVRIHERLDSIDSKLHILIEGFPPAITPEIHEQMAATAADDPRNVKVETDGR